MTDLLTFTRQLRAAYNRDTTELPELWHPENPSTGQCHVTAILIQQQYGGTIIEGMTAEGIGHYWNEIDGITIDATRDQFPTELTMRTLGPATPPLPVTRDKAALLARLAGTNQKAMA